ncbi:trans-aconitate 2-methyltransferase [Pseudorhodoplanes sp.]|uniref:trans-aconitate 2-methyltransferase n=1 Tax=Pseudorhodoplanes sp. TaxID=1934341 RepID=UPI002BECC568|nr:trans-aconitate 2-methyltransferase [Pseudorhodoplanes sp.]HWV52456.1 trans-aconitate 2-methyltransferase [Pseudorhodoplanes sp.]
MADWSAQQYLKFEDERTRPARDLLAQIPLATARRVFDLGCGPGNSTELLVARYPDAEITGIDSSPDMLRQARTRLPQCRFIEADLTHWSAPADADILYSNATFQWLPDHLGVMLRLLNGLKAGGVLAIQVPDNLDEPSHVWMREVAHEQPFVRLLPKNPRDRAVLPSVGEYYDALKPHCARLDIWHTLYQHALDGAEAIVEWVKGTGLRPFLDPLPPAERDAFLRAYTARIAAAYPARYDGKVLLRFPRLFIVASR